MNSGLNVPASQWLVRIGFGLIGFGAACFVLVIAGFVPLAVFAFGGTSGLKTIAAVAVLGCLVTAFGYWKADLGGST